MLVRVSNSPNSELYLNTDQIRSVAFRCVVCTLTHEPHQHIVNCYIDLIGHSPKKPLQIAEDAGRLILMLVDANDALLDHTASDITSQALASPGATMPRASLTTRIAQLLRDTWKTAGLDQIMIALNTHDASAVLTALDQLVAEKVVLVKDGDGDTLYYHASQRNAFQKPNVIDCPECNSTGKQTFTGKINDEEKAMDAPCFFCNGTGKLQQVEPIKADVNAWDYGCETCGAYNHVLTSITAIDQANCTRCTAPAPPWLRDNFMVKQLITRNPDQHYLLAVHAETCQQCAAVINGSTQELCGTGKFLMPEGDLSSGSVAPLA